MSDEEKKEEWYSSIMNDKGNILIKILGEKYANYVVEITNIHATEAGRINFDVLDFPEELDNDQEFIHKVQLAVGDILARAITVREADIAKAEHTVQDIYFTDILKKYHVHTKSQLTTTQAMKCVKLYPIPLLDDEEDLPSEDADIEEYYENIQGKCDYGVIDLDSEDKKVYNMTKEEDVEVFLTLLKTRGSDYFF